MAVARPPSAEPFVPPASDIHAVAEAAKGCRGCPLWENATQTVFGEGADHPQIMLVGEQPGDKEDLQGHPFVGPAGRVLNESLEQAGVSPTTTYTTNAVKHFKWEARGHRRLHKKPNRTETNACRPWLEAEIRILRPKLIVALGATAAQSLLGWDFKLTENRGRVLPSDFGTPVLVTVHPSSLLRIPEHDRRVEERARFVEDLRMAADYVRA